jgi:esterase/lipase superfamily enzyme
MPLPIRLPRRAVLCVAILLLAACAPRYVAKNAAPNPAASIEPIYVVTERALDRTGPDFGGERSFILNHFRADISIPPTHETGKIEWATDTPDTSRDFAVVDTAVFANGAAMKRDLRAQRETRETMVFVHGYNNTLSEAMYRFAQIRADFDRPGQGVLFSWQSAGDPRGYIYDRDSVLFARDDLVRTLRLLTNEPGETVLLVAHSMGAQLTMEALRQIAIGKERHLLNRVSGVVLISPDIDLDVFRSQVQTIGKLSESIVVLVSSQDRVLGLASLLFGSKKRLGVIDSPEQVAGLDVRVIDVTALSDGMGLSHFIPVTSPAAVEALRSIAAPGRRQTSLLEWTILGTQ